MGWDDHWSDDREQQLRELWKGTLTGTQIAIVLGATRNAVIGKAHRLGLVRWNDRGNSETRLAERNARAVAAKRAARDREGQRRLSVKNEARETVRIAELAAVAQRAADDAALVSGGVSLFDITRDRCRWPLNEAYPIDRFRFCGDPTDGGSYCEHHRGLAYSNHQRRIRWGAEAVE
jgi:GcrA cell cycle regulator